MRALVQSLVVLPGGRVAISCLENKIILISRKRAYVNLKKYFCFKNLLDKIYTCKAHQSLHNTCEVKLYQISF